MGTTAQHCSPARPSSVERFEPATLFDNDPPPAAASQGRRLELAGFAAHPERQRPVDGKGRELLDVDELRGAMERNRSRARAANTDDAYRADWSVFTDWAATRGLEPLPAAPLTVEAFIADQAALGHPPVTIRRRVSTISTAHARSSLADPANQQVTEALQGVDRQWGEAGNTPNQAPALPIDRLAVVVDAIALEGPDDNPDVRGLRDRVVLLVGYAGLFRASELAGIQCRHVTIDNDGATITLPWTKTSGKGRDRVTYTAAIPRAADPALCPTTALVDWHDLVCGPGCRWRSKRYVIRSVNRWGTIGNGATAVHRRSISRIVTARASAAGLGEDYTSHSLRRGGATKMAHNGATARQLEQAGRWAPGSAVAQRYVEESEIGVAIGLLGFGSTEHDEISPHHRTDDPDQPAAPGPAGS